MRGKEKGPPGKEEGDAPGHTGASPAANTDVADSCGLPGIPFNNGVPWKRLRQFTLTTLKNFGMGNKSTEERILEEAHFLVERLKTLTLYNFFPTLMDYIPGPHQRIFKHFEELRKFVLERVEMHRVSLEPSGPRDFINAFLIKIKQEQQNSQSEFTTESLLRTTLSLFFAGTGTTSAILKHGLLLLMKYPEIEVLVLNLINFMTEKVHVEIDCVIGRSQRPCMAYRSQMPYTEAVVHEIQRFISLTPLGAPHAVTRQYIIPKGTTIFPALKSVLYDSKAFPKPEQFNPGHFLDENGAFKKSDFFMPFSIGKQSCMGEGLARTKLFLLLTTILQNFILKPLIDPKDIDITPMNFTSNTPVSYQFIVIPR
ncbi:unnamed protein product [Caretta caretta]